MLFLALSALFFEHELSSCSFYYFFFCYTARQSTHAIRGNLSLLRSLRRLLDSLNRNESEFHELLREFGKGKGRAAIFVVNLIILVNSSLLDGWKRTNGRSIPEVVQILGLFLKVIHVCARFVL